jgi:hypothetical protein
MVGERGFEPPTPWSRTLSFDKDLGCAPLLVRGTHNDSLGQAPSLATGVRRLKVPAVVPALFPFKQTSRCQAYQRRTGYILVERLPECALYKEFWGPLLRTTASSQLAPRDAEVSYCNLAYSAFACLRIGTSTSASFQRARKSSYADFALVLSPSSA